MAGTVSVPGDKSISHRALILSALARGTSRIRNVLQSADVQSTAAVLRALGTEIPSLADDITITGGGTLHPPGAPLDCGNSGTTARLMAGVVAGSAVRATFIGDASLSRRPMRRVAEPLTRMGARIELPSHGGLPMAIAGGPLRHIDWESPIASAQVKSAILLAALQSGTSARIREPQRSRDHTERMLVARGVSLHRSADAEGEVIELDPAQILRPLDVVVPGDPSSAAFFVALGVLARDGSVRLDDVCLNPTRTGFFDVLRRMGGIVDISNVREEGGEPVGTLLARPSSLRGVTIAAHEVASLIDELPLFACVASRATGASVVAGAGELRVKESDRIQALVANLHALGGSATELPDGFRIEGGDAPLRGAVRTFGDHRIAMAFGVLSALPGNEIGIDEPDCADVSYPGFWKELERVSA